MNSFVDVRKVYIILGKACNFKCRYCIQAGNPPAHLKKAPSDKLIDFLKMLAERQPRIDGVRQSIKVNFFGGEPLLYLDTLKEIVERVGKANVDWQVVTNGSLLTEEFARYANRHNMRVLLSYDGKNTKDTRGIDVLGNSNIVEIIKSISQTSIETLLTARNQDPYALIEKMKAIFGHKMRFKMMFLTISHLMPEDLLDYDLEAWKKTCERMSDAALEQFKTGQRGPQFWESDFYWGYINAYYDYAQGLNQGSQCGMKGNQLYLDLDGRVWFCNNAVGELGSIDDGPEALTEAFDDYYAKTVKANKAKCARCRWLPFCRGKCPLEPDTAQHDKNCEFMGIFFASVESVMKRFAVYKRQIHDLEHTQKVSKRVVIFHRPANKSRTEHFDVNSATNSRAAMRDATYRVSVSDSHLILDYRFRWLGRDIMQSIKLPLIPWTYRSLTFRPTLNRTDVRDETRDYLSAMAPIRHVFADENGSVGRIAVTDKEVLIFLRGRITDIAGFENVHLQDSENSVAAFSRFSPDFKAFFERIQAKKDFIERFDLYDNASYLEAQLDVLTKVVLDSGIADKNALLPVLKAAENCGIHRFDSKEKLLSKVADKANFRKLQLAYLDGKNS